jgi:hypothetical protein
MVKSFTKEKRIDIYKKPLMTPAPGHHQNTANKSKEGISYSLRDKTNHKEFQNNNFGY